LIYFAIPIGDDAKIIQVTGILRGLWQQ
jgi:hypothetical protein